MRWRLRRADVDDAPHLALIAAASFLETFAGVLDGADIVAHLANKSAAGRFADWVNDPGSIVTLAEHAHGAAPIGYTVLTTPDGVDPVEPDDLELRRIYTLAPTHGTGLGAALMAQAVQDTRALGKSRLVLGVLDTNARARRFYERQGFGLTGSRRFQVGSSWLDDLVYARPV